MKNQYFLAILSFILILMNISCKQEKAFITLPSIISNGMVLQQKTQIKLWGEANANASIVITAGWGKTIKTKANENGKWMAIINTPAAGPAFDIQFRNDDTVFTVHDVLLGEVWLASGQSNMEMPLEGWPPNDTIQNSETEINQAHFADIRVFTVNRAYSFIPQTNVSGQWEKADTSLVGEFSATAYFFAKKLHQKLKVPVGIIHSSWGGTPVESWISAEKLHAANEFIPEIQAIKEAIPLEQNLNNWLDSLPSITISDTVPEISYETTEFMDSMCASQTFDDSQWASMQLPISWETTEVGHFDGNIWFRKMIEIPETWLNKNLILELGPIDDMDLSYFNGEKIGENLEDGLWQKKRIYKINKSLVINTINLIAIRVTDIQGGGGIYGNWNDLKIYPENDISKAISLAGEWKYLPTAEYRNNKFYLYNIANREYFARPKVPIQASPNTPTCLYNAMIAPLLQYTIKGAIWYQGESNVGRAKQYSKTFPLMIENWRKEWQLGNFPFYFVQIAPFQYESGTNSAPLRDAQRLSLRTPNTGMAVTLDIGDINNIHPANKKDVGERLALWALAKDYGESIVYSGPLYHQMKVENSLLRISFTHIGSGLMINGTTLKEFEIAGEDGIFYPAKATVNNNVVILQCEKVKNPKAARYAFSNAPDGNLFNKEGLPASSFTTEKLTN